MTDVVLDAAAVLAWAFHEPGREVVASVASRSLISAVNYAEVVSKLVSEGGADLDDAIVLLARTGFEVVPADHLDAIAVARLSEQTRRTGTSLADRFFLALARSSGLPGLTTDRRLAALDVGVEIRLIR